MRNPQQWQQLSTALRCYVPDIQQLQLLTLDGLALHSEANSGDEDAISALSALLLSATQRLAMQLGERAEAAKGVIVCIGAQAYVITPCGDECLLGLQVPAHLGLPQLLQRVCHVVSEQQNSNVPTYH